MKKKGHAVQFFLSNEAHEQFNNFVKKLREKVRLDITRVGKGDVVSAMLSLVTVQDVEKQLKKMI